MSPAQDPFIAFCDQLYEASRLPLAISDAEGRYLSFWPELSTDFIFRRVAQLVLQDFALQHRDETHPLILYNEPGFFTGILRLPDGRYCLAGPAGPLPHSREEVLAFCAGAVAPAYLKAYCSLLMNVPMLSLPQMKALLCLLAQAATGQVVSPADVLFCDNTNLRPATTPALSQQLFENREDMEGHVPGDFETAICDAIARGDEQELARRMVFPTQGRNGRMSDNPLHQTRYTFIGFITLVTRAAVRGGLPAETAFSLSDVYCQRMDVMTNPDRIARLLYASAMDFCHRVKEARADAGNSPLVRQCLAYIAVHLHETLRLDDLAVQCGVSTRTLTSRFRQETGTTIAEYIQAERVREACYLLRHTKYSLSDIAFFLNFSTQSYFIQAFRRHMGCTPYQYRRRG
ncbi:AraC family transcriptional regulator [uncultured Gemmiger sp.]|uniref:AraC family transcriptional regulator n=1 Tax=uncultured Gemmiger sp. TaxID=1623490 RepID=UPI0025EE238F|nr:AraC family transcriptional regulator [uncultured Gemmiger sp.]